MKFEDVKIPEMSPELEAEWKKVLSENFEEFKLSELILVDWTLQGRCEHCRTGRRVEDAEHCRNCQIRHATRRLDELFQKTFKEEKGCECPTRSIPKCLDRTVIDLKGLEALEDRTVRLPVMDMIDCEDCIDKICAQCKDHHPDRAAAGECKRCACTGSKKALEVDVTPKDGKTWKDCTFGEKLAEMLDAEMEKRIHPSPFDRLKRLFRRGRRG